jgi:radical SAM superfamily enzyme YgiQ (UPF0313 family)
VIGAITLVSLFRSSRDERVLPLGCLWLRAALEARGVEVALVDAQQLPEAVAEDPDALADLLSDPPGGGHRVVGLSAMTDALPLAVALARRLKARDPERVVILGGWGPTTVARPLVEAFDWIDLVVRGEGELILPAVLEALDGGDLRRVPGLSGRLPASAGREVFHTPSAPPIHDVAGLPEPRLDDLDLAKAYSYYTTVTARGCPYRCKFCEIPTVEERRVRARTVAQVIAELTHVHRAYGVEYVGFQDDIFLLSRHRVEAILDGLDREGVALRWGGFARAGRVDGAWYGRLAERGLEQVTFGIEGGSDGLLDRMAKGLSLEKAFSGIADALARTSVRCFFLWGFPDESLADFLGTAQAVYHAELLGAAVEIGQVVPLAGAPLTLAFEGPLEHHERYPFCRIIVPPAHPELAALVRDHPAIFSAFYAFPTPERDLKYALAGQLCCRP